MLAGLCAAAKQVASAVKPRALLQACTAAASATRSRRACAALKSVRTRGHPRRAGTTGRARWWPKCAPLIYKTQDILFRPCLRLVSTFFFCSCKAKRSAAGWEPGSCPIDEAQLAHVDQLRHGGATGANREAISRLEAAQNASPRHISRELHTHHPAQGCARAIRMVLAESWLRH